MISKIIRSLKYVVRIIWPNFISIIMVKKLSPTYGMITKIHFPMDQTNIQCIHNFAKYRDFIFNAEHNAAFTVLNPIFFPTSDVLLNNKEPITPFLIIFELPTFVILFEFHSCILPLRHLHKGPQKYL